MTNNDLLAVTSIHPDTLAPAGFLNLFYVHSLFQPTTNKPSFWRKKRNVWPENNNVQCIVAYMVLHHGSHIFGLTNFPDISSIFFPFFSVLFHEFNK